MATMVAPPAQAWSAAAQRVGRSSSASSSSERVVAGSASGTPHRPLRLKPHASTPPPPRSRT